MDVEVNHVVSFPHKQTITNRTIPPSHRNNFISVNSSINSPVRHPHSTLENDLSELDDFQHDPNTKMVFNQRKESKLKGNDTMESKSKNSITNHIQSTTTTSSSISPALVPSTTASKSKPYDKYRSNNNLTFIIWVKTLMGLILHHRVSIS